MPWSYLRKSLKYSINILSSSILFFFALSLIKQSLSTHSTTSSHSAVALQNQNELHRSPFLLPNKSPALIFIVIPPCYTCLPFPGCVQRMGISINTTLKTNQCLLRSQPKQNVYYSFSNSVCLN